MDGSYEILNPNIYEPQDGESPEKYFQRYNDEDLKVIASDPILLQQLGEQLRRISELFRAQSEPTDELQILWKEIKKMKNYGRLKQFVDELKFVRKKLLVALNSYATNIERYAKYLSSLRLVCSVGDMAMSVAGMFVKDSALDYSKEAFTAASVLGIFGTLSTFSETYLLVNATRDISQQILKDQTLYGPIKKWFEQTESLKQAMLNVFPFENSKFFLQEFSKTVDTEMQGADLFVNFFAYVIETDIDQLRNTRFLRNLLGLLSIPNIGDLCRLMIFLHNPVHLEIARMFLQLNQSSLEHIFFQHIPWLSASQQNLWSPPVWGRLSFNFLTALHAFNTLMRPEISNIACEMRNLRKHLDDQLKKLDEITNYVDSNRHSI